MAWRQLARSTGVLILLATSGFGRGDAGAQEIALAGREPRFLARTPNAAPKVLDVRNTPILRQQIAIDLDDVTLRAALAEITRQTGITFVYMRDVIDPETRVNLRASRISVAGAIREILLDTGVDLLFSSARQAALVRRPDVLHVQTGAIVGWVTDAKSGEKLSGVDVFLDGTRWRAVTDTSGRYRLTEVDTGTYTLIARRLGYGKQSRKVTARAEQEDTVNLALDKAAVSLDELVTTATGQQRRRDLGNAITTIRADSVLQTAPIRNLSDLLENRVPGLTSQRTSGAPGDPTRMRLRGISSVMRGNDPVVIVDGIRMYAAQSDARSGNLTNLAVTNLRDPTNPLAANDRPAPSPLDQIDPNIIETVEVFKGPSAATMYGPDAANGVIVITTKKGRPGPMQWSASFTQGRTTTAGRWPEGYYPWGHVPLMGGIASFCPITFRACELDSLVRYQSLNDPDFSPFDRGRRSALSATAAGGTQAMTYSVTATYTDEVGLLKLPDFEMQRFQEEHHRPAPAWMERPWRLNEWSVTSNIGVNLSRTADVGLMTVLSRSQQERTDLESRVASMAGTYVDKVSGLYYSPGRGSESWEGGYVLQPMNESILRDYYRRTSASAVNVTTSLQSNWRPRPWLTTRGQVGLNVIFRNDELFLPTGLPTSADSGILAQGAGRSLKGTLNLQGTVRKPLWRGFVFETNVGANLESTSITDIYSSAEGLVTGTSSMTGARYSNARDGRVSTSGYGWYIEPTVKGERLSLSLGIRLDGSSAYGTRIQANSGGGTGLGSLLALPKLNGSWVISEEPFFPFKSFFSSLRLRGAFGQAQVQPNPIDRFRIYTSRVDPTGQLSILRSVGNDNLRPERSVEVEAGFDADILASRLSIEMTGYRKSQVDALMPVQLPVSINGGGSMVQNIGNILNTGVEVTVGITPIQTSAVTWSTQVFYNRSNNRMVKLGPGVERDPHAGLVVGYPVRGRWAQPILGYADQNGDGVLAPHEVQIGDSMVYMGRLLPDFTSAIHSSLNLFGGMIGISAGFSYDAGAVRIDETAKKNWVLAPALADRSTPLSQQAAVVALDSTEYGLMQEVSTFRFNSFSVNYRAPRGVASFVGAQQLSIAIQGSNLGMRSTYRGKDPNVNQWSPTEDIVDTGQIPMPRMWQIRFDLRY